MQAFCNSVLYGFAVHSTLEGGKATEEGIEWIQTWEKIKSSEES